MKYYVFIDETGDLGVYGSRYFIITAIWIDNPEIFDRIIKNIRRHKFRKELYKAQEIKANKSSKQLIEYLLKEFSRTNGHAQSIILEKNNIIDDKDYLYNYICGYLSTIAMDATNLDIRIDKSKIKQGLIDEFNNYISQKFIESKWNRKVNINHSWSQSWSGLQIADIISWAIFQKFEHNNNYYYDIISRKINIIAVPAGTVRRAPQGTTDQQVLPASNRK